jgi:glucan 1,3-beta-glucosidase
LIILTVLAGAPLSQNGFDNSGQRTLSPQWTSRDTISFTNWVIGKIADQYADNDAVVGIELINEPLMASLPGGQGAVRSYYTQGYNTIAGRAPTIISDGFVDPSNWNGFLSGSGGAILDHHEYQVFSNADVALSYSDHVSQVYARARTWAQGQDKFLINGEWSAAMTDCAPGLVSPVLVAR